MIEVYLTQELKTLGQKGEIKRVKEGYFRNFLLPRKIAVLATPELKLVSGKRMEKQRKSQEEAKKRVAEIQQKFEGKKVAFVRKATAKQKLYAAITAKHIAKALEEEHGITVSEGQIHIKEPLKSIGEFPVEVELAPGVKGKIIVAIEQAKL